MKNYQEFISELNKYEKETVKKARGLFIKQLGIKKYVQKGLSKLNKANPFMASNAHARSMPENPYVSPRRESENVIKRFQDTEPGQKGAGNRVDPKTGKVTQYDVTKVRHDDARGLSKRKTANIEKILRKSGNKVEADVIRNIGGSADKRLYKPPFSGTELERASRQMDIFPKNKLGAPTTETIPKGKIPEPSKVNPPPTFKPPKGSVGAMKTTKTPNFITKGRNLLNKVSKIKNKKAAALAFGAGALAGGIAAYRNRNRNKVDEGKITSSPYINKETGIEDKNWDGTVKAGPTIHFGGKRKGKYPNNILDLKDDDPLKKQYFNEPETKEYFKNNPTIKMKFYGEDEPRTYTNPYKKKGTSALESKPGQMPAG